MKEVNHIINGFLLFILLAGIVGVIKFVASMEISSPPPLAEQPAFSNNHNALPSNVRKGKELFNLNCAGCHGIHKPISGPALVGVEGRWENRKLLLLWIRN